MSIEKEFYVHGMHCPACEILIEDKLAQAGGVKSVKANLSTCKVSVCADNALNANDLSKFVEEFGYKISDTPEKKSKPNTKTLGQGLLIATLVFTLFLLLQKLGIVELINPTQVTLPFVFLIGVVASVSTCMAVVGGLVLSISATYSRDKNYGPLVAFHVSRIVGFFILGGLIGILGSAFVLTSSSYFVMQTILFVVMLIMGLNMLDVFSFTHKAQIKMPKVFSKSILALQSKNGVIPASLMGIATFVLPCGFTQSMQIYSLTTGNFIQGALTMFVFALGTFPVLSLISFASFKFKSKLFITSAGFLVLIFALFNFVSGLRGLGLV